MEKNVQVTPSQDKEVIQKLTMGLILLVWQKITRTNNIIISLSLNGKNGKMRRRKRKKRNIQLLVAGKGKRCVCRRKKRNERSLVNGSKRKEEKEEEAKTTVPQSPNKEERKENRKRIHERKIWNKLVDE